MSSVFKGGYALLVGVGADLPVTAADARALGQILVDPELCAYPEAQVRVLTENDARRESVLTHLEWLADTAGPGDTVVIFFSGHGIQQPDYYIVPHGFAWHDLPRTAISENELTQRLRRIQSSKLVVFLDCCHAGGQARPKAITGEPLPQSVVEEFVKGSGRVVIASSRRDEVSYTGSPYSVFTKALIEGLSGNGAFEDDGFVRILDVALHVGRMVPAWTSDKQHPIVKVSDLSDNFAIAKNNHIVPKSDKPRAAPYSGPGNTTAESSLRRQLGNYQRSLLLIDERISDYVEYTSVPLQLIRSRHEACTKILEIEGQLRLQAAHDHP